MFEQEKQKGNSFYLQVKSIKLSRSDLFLLQEAEQHYQKAITLCQNNSERASIYKNLMMVEGKRMQTEDRDGKILLDKFSKILSMYEQAKQFSSNGNKPSDWIQDLDAIFENKISQTCNILMKTDIFDLPSQVNFLSKLNVSLGNKYKNQQVLIQSLVLRQQESLIQEYKAKKNYNRAENEFNYYSINVKNLHQIIEFCQNADVRKTIQEKFNKLPTDSFEYDALRLLNQANKLYAQSKSKQETDEKFKMIDCDDIWIAIDLYKSLIRNFEGNFLILEAEAFAKLGFIEKEMFGMTSSKLKSYIFSSVSLILTNNPYIPESWFSEAKQLLKTLQDEEIQKEQGNRDEWRAKNKKIYDEIQDQKNNGANAFIKWILANHKSPNQSKDFKLENQDFQNMKKTLLKVIRLYHSDKVVNSTTHFKNIAREIVIVLNNFYECYK